MVSIVGAFFWNVFMAGQYEGEMGLLFSSVFGLRYFLAVLLFFLNTGRRWKWETAAFVAIGLICCYQIYRPTVTPEYLRSDVQRRPDFRVRAALDRNGGSPWGGRGHSSFLPYPDIHEEKQEGEIMLLSEKRAAECVPGGTNGSGLAPFALQAGSGLPGWTEGSGNVHGEPLC